MPFIHTYHNVSEMNEYHKYDKCNQIKSEYLNCLQDKNSPKKCKYKLTELLFCLSQTKQPPTIIKKIH